MKKSFPLHKKIKNILYKLVLPTLVVINFIFISGNIDRPNFGNSEYIDIFVRVWISLFFCIGYFMLSDMGKYEHWFYGNRWQEYLHEDIFARIINLIMDLLFGAFAALITWWSIQYFLPPYTNIAVLLSIINGILFFIPKNSHVKTNNLTNSDKT